jgi:hypothetical protein
MPPPCCGDQSPAPRALSPHTHSVPVPGDAAQPSSGSAWTRQSPQCRAITNPDAAAVADAFGELSQAAGELAGAVTREDAGSRPSARTRAQGAA